MVSQSFSEKIHTDLEVVRTFDLEKMRHGTAGNALFPDAVVNNIRPLKRIFFSEHQLDLTIITNPDLAQFSEDLGRIVDVLSELEQRGFNADHFTLEEGGKFAQFAKSCEDALSFWVRWVPLCALLHGSGDTYVNNAKEAEQSLKDNLASSQGMLGKIDKLYSEANELHENASGEIEKLITMAKDSAAIKAVEPFAKVFSEAGKYWQIQALIGLGVAIVGFVGLLAWLRHFLSVDPADFDTIPQTIMYLSPRILITGLLISVMAWGAKQYRIAMHQFTLNKHKADSLQSFEAFIGAASDPDVRDAVLAATAQTIFGQDSTGYLTEKEGGSLDQYSKLMQSAGNTAQSVSKAVT